jgi:hypothetical protein
MACIDRPADGCSACDDAECEALIASEAFVGGCGPSDVDVVCGPLEMGDTCCYVFSSQGMICDGRPFTVDGAARTAAACARPDWARRLHPRAAQAQELTEAWTQRALDEHASVAAFARFVLELLSVGAPAELVREAIAAMHDEVEHARLAFGLASEYAGEPIGPGPLSLDAAMPARGLADIAVAALVEGGVGETLAAVRAATAADEEPDPAVRTVLETIASDETRHAALAWRFVAWAMQVAPDLRPLLERTLERAMLDAPEIATAILRPCWRAISRPRDRPHGNSYAQSSL